MKPEKDKLRELYLKSGNQCAFPACNNLMMNKDGDFVVVVCHIEAAMPGGERFNKNKTNCLNFSYLYYGLYLHNPIIFKININAVSITGFIMLRFRTLFLSDYVNLIPLSGLIIKIILFESVTGVMMFGLLINSFSMISEQQGKKYFSDLQVRINTKMKNIEGKK